MHEETPMQFSVRTTGNFYETEAKERLERLGFQFVSDERAHDGGWWIHGEGRVDLVTLEELLAFQQQCGCPVILSEDTLEIYDDYRE